MDDGDFDLIWLDGSDSAEARDLTYDTSFNKCRLVEVYLEVKGKRTNVPGSHPADAIVLYGLKRLLGLGYDYVGLLENDVEFTPGWFDKMMQTIELAKSDGLKVGGVTARTFTDRVVEDRGQYVLMWNMGAGNVLFSREGAQTVIDTYGYPTVIQLYEYFRDTFHKHVYYPSNDVWGGDCAFAMNLYKHGMVSLGTKPTMARNFDKEWSYIV